MGPAKPMVLGKKVSNAGPVFDALGGGKTAEVVEPANEDAFAGARRAGFPQMPADARGTHDATRTRPLVSFMLQAGYRHQTKRNESSLKGFEGTR